jgi:hypothetical protein
MAWLFMSPDESRTACAAFALLVGSAAMNGGPIVWGVLGGIAVLALRAILTKLEHGDPILPKLNGTRADKEQALLVTIRLRSGEMGDKKERERLTALQHQLSDALENSSAGELDGDEYGGGTCTIYMYGPSAERLLSVTWPILKAFRAPSGSYVITRCGNSDEEEQRIPLDGD